MSKLLPLLSSLKLIRKCWKDTSNPKILVWSLINFRLKLKNTENNMKPSRKYGSQKFNLSFQVVRWLSSLKELQKTLNVDSLALYFKFLKITKSSLPFTILSMMSTWDIGWDLTQTGLLTHKFMWTVNWSEVSMS